MPASSLTRFTGRFFLLTACALACPANVRAETSAVMTLASVGATRLDDFVVSSTRTPQDPRFTPSSVTALDVGELRKIQVDTLAGALRRTPGLSIVSLGGRGSQTSLYVRGAEADHVLFFVDGVRMNSAQASYASYLGGADLAGLERLELLRGPQSTLYGSSAIGGVVLLETAATGAGPISGVFQAHAGSFDTLGGSIASRGAAGPIRYSASLGVDRSDNDRPDNAFKILSYSTRLESEVVPTLLLGVTLRGQDGAYDEVGSTVFPSHGRSDNLNHLVTTYAQWTPATTFSSRLTAGWHQNEYTWIDKTYGPSSNFYSRNTRQIVDWQNTWDAAPWVRVVGGVNAEWSTYASGGDALSDELRSAYLSTSLRPTRALTIEGGLRTDHYDLTSRATTWRSGASYRIESTGTKLRTTYGTGFKAPTVVNRFGAPPWYGASPTIGPEKSTGWDFGIDQEIAGGKLVASATYFQNRFRDLILNAYDFASGKFVAANVKRARSEGVELAFASRPIEPLTLRAAYTYTSALDLSATKATRLPRRPRHIADLDARYQFTAAWFLGIGVHCEWDRVLSATVRLEDFTTARIYTSYGVSETVSLKFRVENALDERYSEVAGYPALSRSFIAAVEWKF